MSDIQNFDVLEQKISELQNLLSNAMMKDNEISEDTNFNIQEQLDSLEYYIKSMPKDSNILFR